MAYHILVPQLYEVHYILLMLRWDCRNQNRNWMTHSMESKSVYDCFIGMERTILIPTKFVNFIPKSSQEWYESFLSLFNTLLKFHSITSLIQFL